MIICMYTSGQKGLHIHSFMEQTTLITGIVGGAGIDPPPWKMDTFFLGSLALSMPFFLEISNQMEVNGEVSNIQLEKLYKKSFRCLILRQLAPF